MKDKGFRLELLLRKDGANGMRTRPGPDFGYLSSPADRLGRVTITSSWSCTACGRFPAISTTWIPNENGAVAGGNVPYTGESVVVRRDASRC